ncbi:hypothetical protein BKA65DRAFT_545860 [Rhexocercosporidium sp. MPI-PUGE-AT-0058]|nr:hypothetical protein BKA65DRAFT_545860 [Rhexocercosporidium sp. MPI-PUGE-AT-0058]
MAGNTKRIKRLNPTKKANKDEKKKKADDGISKSRKIREERRDKILQKKALKEKLQKQLENAAEEEAKQIQAQIDTVMTELADDESALEDAKAKEEQFEREAEEAEKEDEYDDMEVDDGPEGDPPLKKSIETDELPYDLKELMEGLQLRDEYFDLSQEGQLRATQVVHCYKNGAFGTPSIVVDREFPESHIYRIRTDIQPKPGTADLMKWRRAGKKNPRTGKNWCVEDMVEILPRIAIQVPPGYEGNPEDLVKLIPPISGTERDALKAAGKRIPMQPEVQLLITWKEGIVPEGETKMRFTSWESRSGCRTLWKRHAAADILLVDVARRREQAYRKAGGKNSSERSISPFAFPSAGSTPDREYTLTPERGEEEKKEEEEKKKKEEEEKKKKEEEEKKKKEEEEKEKNKEEKEAFDPLKFKAALDDFEIIYRARKGIAVDAELTPIQEGALMEVFKPVWAERQKKDSKL